MRLTWRQILPGLLVGAVCMALAFTGIPLSSFFTALAELRPLYLGVFTAMLVVQVGLMTLRQHLLLAPVAPSLSLGRGLSIMLIGTFCIQAFPVRLGELVRPWLLHRHAEMPLSTGLGLIALERAVDLLAMLLVLVSVLLWVEVPSTVLELPGLQIDVVAWGWSTARLLVPLLAAGVLALVIGGHTLVTRLTPLARRLLGDRAGPLLAAAQGFTESFRVLQEPLRLAGVVGLTGLLWLDVAAMYWVLGFAFGLEDQVHFGAATGVMTITALGALLPSPPGMAGVQEALGRGALALFGVRGGGLDALALGYAVVIHWWQLALIALGALVALSRDGERVRDVVSRSQEIAPAARHRP